MQRIRGAIRTESNISLVSSWRTFGQYYAEFQLIMTRAAGTVIAWAHRRIQRREILGALDMDVRGGLFVR
jgi:hypothetical protein